MQPGITVENFVNHVCALRASRPCPIRASLHGSSACIYLVEIVYVLVATWNSAQNHTVLAKMDLAST